MVAILPLLQYIMFNRKKLLFQIIYDFFFSSIVVYLYTL